MKRGVKLLGTLFVLLAVAKLVTRTANAEIDPQLLKLASAVYGGIDGAKGALGELTGVEAVVRDIEAGKKPSVAGNRWTALGDHYAAAAKKVIEAPSPTDFNKDKYAFSVAELQNCDTRAVSITKAKDLLAELNDAWKRGMEAVAVLDQGATHASASREALRYLIDVHSKLVSVPIYSKIFQWDWFELQTHVSSSLADFDSAIDRQRKKLNVEMTKLDGYSQNLASNISQIEKLSCSLDAVWRGSASSGGTTLPMEFQVTRTGTAWGGEINLNDMGDKFRDVSVNGRTIMFTIGQPNDPLRFTGTMASDGFTMAGTFTFAAGNGSFQVRRQ